MATLRKAQTGNRVYRGNSQSPNRGQVSGQGAQGYLQRELRKDRNPVTPVGRDGKSDSRSGVASSALKRLGGTGWGSISNRSVRPTSGGTAPINSSAVEAATATNVPNTPAPVVQTHANGVLELPYDQNYSAEQFGLIGQANQDLLDLQMEEQQADMEFATGTRDANIAFESLRKQTLSGAGGTGTVFSSQYGNQVADQSTQYSNMLADLTGQNALTKSALAQRRAAINSSLNQQLAALTQQYADQLAAQAGDLGFSTAGPPDAVPSAAPAGPAHATYDPSLTWNSVSGGNAKGTGSPEARGPRPSPNHVWRDGRWIKWSQTTAGKRGEPQPRD